MKVSFHPGKFFSRPRRSISLICTFSLLFAFACTPAKATTLLRMSLAQISQAAPVIVRGECVASSSAWDAGEIWTFTTFQVLEVWRGFSRQAAPARIVIRLLGGSAGNLTSHVAGIPHFLPGEDVVLFLEPNARGDFSIVSWQQGTFRVRRDARSGEETITQDSASFATFDPSTRRFAATGIRNRPLTVFHSAVDAALSLAQPSRRQNP